jgi:hypothetical protein
MTFSRYESVSLPQTDDGRYMAKQYAEDMENAMLTVSIENTTTSIKVIGRFMGEIPDETVAKLREMDCEI